MDGAVSPTGGFAAEVPLDLPSPRGSVPIPLSIVYTGSARAGAAGQGWDVPLTYVRRSTSVRRRKPFANHPQTNAYQPIAAARVTLSLGGQTQLMRKVNLTWLPARGSSYMELRENGDEWSLKTLDNHEYVFRRPAAVGAVAAGALAVRPEVFDGLWLLAEVHDTIGGDKVVLRYDVPRVGECSAGLALRSLAYTFDAAGTTISPQRTSGVSRSRSAAGCRLNHPNSAAISV